MTDTKTLISAPVDSAPPLAGAIMHRADCGHDVWLAPSSQEMLAEMDHVLCISCGEALIKADPNPTFQEPTERQLREIKEFLS